MFRISPEKISREATKVPNTVSASSRIKPITVSQPSVITKKNVNSDLNGLSSTGLDNTKTRRPNPRSNTKNDRVPFVFKSSRSKNKEVKVEEHHRNLLLSKKNKHISSACNNSKIDSQNTMSKASKPKNVGIRESLATPKPRKPRFLLRWSPTGRLFDQDGKLVAPSNSERHIDCSKGYPDLFMVRRLRLFQAHDMKSKASHQFRLEVYGNFTDSKDSPSDERHEIRDGRHVGRVVSTTWIARQPGGDVKVPNHQDAPRDADSHI
nr:hypothetical protein [Tanacetum cinerariifolium]